MSIQANMTVCYEAHCDSCGEGDNREWGGAFHYESYVIALEELQGHDWVVTNSALVICDTCIEQEPHPVGDVGVAVEAIVARIKKEQIK